MAQSGPVYRCGEDGHEHSAARIRCLRRARRGSHEVTQRERERNSVELGRAAMTTSTHTATVQSWLDGFGAALSRGDYATASAMFGSDAYWRDLVAFTWNIKTAEDPAAIREVLAATVPS